MKRAGFSRERIIGILPEPEPEPEPEHQAGAKTAVLAQCLAVRVLRS